MLSIDNLRLSADISPVTKYDFIHNLNAKHIDEWGFSEINLIDISEDISKLID